MKGVINVVFDEDGKMVQIFENGEIGHMGNILHLQSFLSDNINRWLIEHGFQKGLKITIEHIKKEQSNKGGK